MKNDLEKFWRNCYEMHEFLIDFLLPGLSLMLIFIAEHYCLLVLGFCEYFFGRSLYEKCFICSLKGFLLWAERHLSQHY